MSYPSFEEELGIYAPWWQMPFVFAIWIVGISLCLGLKALIWLEEKLK